MSKHGIAMQPVARDCFRGKELKRRKDFFFEKKKQKTLVSAPADESRPWPGSWERLKNKSLLVLFFRKEYSYLNLP
jgi:hypothetical protein